MTNALTHRMNSRWEDTFLANSDLSAKLYFAVKVVGENLVDLAGDGDAVIGILINKPTQGQSARVLLDGHGLAVVGTEDIAVGDLAASDASGKTVTATTGEKAYGICVAAGDHTTGRLASIHIKPYGKV